MHTSLVLLLALADLTAPCPLDALAVTPTAVTWGRFRIGATAGEIETQLGAPLELRSQAESPSRVAEVATDGRPVVLYFRDVGGVRTLTGLTISAAADDKSDCWLRESLTLRLRQKLPNARYIPSRHEPGKAEVSNAYPMYGLDRDARTVVQLNPSLRTIYVGRLDELD